MKLSNGILGLTLLAWGNSIPGKTILFVHNYYSTLLEHAHSGGG